MIRATSLHNLMLVFCLMVLYNYTTGSWIPDCLQGEPISALVDVGSSFSCNCSLSLRNDKVIILEAVYAMSKPRMLILATINFTTSLRHTLSFRTGTIATAKYSTDAGKVSFAVTFPRVSLNMVARYRIMYGKSMEVLTFLDLDVRVSGARPFISVSNPAKKVALLKGNSTFVGRENDQLQLSCCSREGRPPSLLIMMENGVVIPSANLKQLTRQSKLTPLLTDTCANYRFILDRSYSEKAVSCQAYSGPTGTPNLLGQLTITFDVQFSPRVSMRLIPYKSSVTYWENSPVRMVCKASGNPVKFSWSWYVTYRDDVTQKLDTNIDRIDVRVTWRHNGAVFGCTATNYAPGNAYRSITVLYAPRLKEVVIENYFARKHGHSVEMHCPVHANPSPHIFWTRVWDHSVVGLGNTVTIKLQSDYDFGYYLCQVTHNRAKETLKRYRISKPNHPRITRTDKVVYGRLHFSVTLSCTAETAPYPRKGGAYWLRRFIRIANSSKRTSHIDHEEPGFTSISLTISMLSATDYGFYNCTFINTHGAASRVIELIPHGDVSVATILGLSLGGIVCFVFTSALLIVCFRTRCHIKERKHSWPGDVYNDRFPGYSFTEMYVPGSVSQTTTIEHSDDYFGGATPRIQMRSLSSTALNGDDGMFPGHQSLFIPRSRSAVAVNPEFLATIDSDTGEHSRYPISSRNALASHNRGVIDEDHSDTLPRRKDGSHRVTAV